MKKDKKVKVLQLITGLGVGGAERIVMELSKELSSRGVDVHLISLKDDKGILSQYDNILFGLHSLEMSKSPFSLIRAVFFVYRYLKLHRISIVHAHMFHALSVAVALKILMPSLKIVFTSHSFFGFNLWRSFFIKSSRTIRSFDIVFSEKQHADMNANAVVIKNAVKLVQTTVRHTTNKFTFLFLGRLELPKNPVGMIKIFSDLKNTNCQLLIAGDGSLRTEVEREIANCKLEGRVNLLGKVSDIDMLFAKVDCLVLPSIWEGLPMVILEAGARGIPVLSTPVGAIPEVIDDKCGYLTKLEQFTETLDEIVSNPQAARIKGHKFRERVAIEFSLDSMVDQHLAIYERLVYG